MDRLRRRRKRKYLERIAEWEVLLDITTAPHVDQGPRMVAGQLKSMRLQIENEGSSVSEEEAKLHKMLIEVNKKRQNLKAV